MIELSPHVVDLIDQSLILVLHPIVLLSLLRVEFIQLFLVGSVDLIDFGVDVSVFVLHLFSFDEELVKLLLLLVVLRLDVVEKSHDVFDLGASSELVLSEVVVCKLTLQLSHLVDQSVVFLLENDVLRVVLVDSLDLLFELGDLTGQHLILLLEDSEIVLFVVDLPLWTDIMLLHANT